MLTNESYNVHETWSLTIAVTLTVLGFFAMCLGGCYMCEQTNREALHCGMKVIRGCDGMGGNLIIPIEKTGEKK